ncbi:MAG: hypothetical protein ACI95X_003195, partial [Paraglaciecola sp.]
GIIINLNSTTHLLGTDKCARFLVCTADDIIN